MDPDRLYECGHCGRTFLVVAYLAHVKACLLTHIAVWLRRHGYVNPDLEIQARFAWRY